MSDTDTTLVIKYNSPPEAKAETLLNNRLTKTVWSTKTMDTVGGYANPKNVYSTLKGYLDKRAKVPEGGSKTVGRFTVDASELGSRKWVLGVPAGTTAEQWTQINKAIEYAKTLNIELIVTVVR